MDSPNRLICSYIYADYTLSATFPVACSTGGFRYRNAQVTVLAMCPKLNLRKWIVRKGLAHVEQILRASTRVKTQCMSIQKLWVNAKIANRGDKRAPKNREGWTGNRQG